MYRLLDSSDERWDDMLELIPAELRDIYMTRAYHVMHEHDGDGVGKLFCFQESEERIGVYPFLMRKIRLKESDGDCYAIESVYGYGGPVLTSDDEGFRHRFEQAFIEFCQRNDVISESLRFHPLLKNERIFNHNIEVFHRRKTVYLDLTQDLDDIWDTQFTGRTRTAIRKAKKMGLIVEESKDFEAFKRIYRETMRRVGAESCYYFSSQYFKQIEDNKHSILLLVKKGETAIAAGIFWGYGRYFHSHLAGSLDEGRPYSPNTLLYWEAVRYAMREGYEQMHFGGGLTGSEQDKLYRFKKSFSRQEADYFMGRRIHNEWVHSKVVMDY